MYGRATGLKFCLYSWPYFELDFPSMAQILTTSIHFYSPPSCIQFLFCQERDIYKLDHFINLFGGECQVMPLSILHRLIHAITKQLDVLNLYYIQDLNRLRQFFQSWLHSWFHCSHYIKGSLNDWPFIIQIFVYWNTGNSCAAVL